MEIENTLFFSAGYDMIMHKETLMKSRMNAENGKCQKVSVAEGIA